MSSNHQPPPGINPTIMASTYSPMPLSVVYSVDYYAWLMHIQKEHTALQEKYDLLAAENSSVKREVEELQVSHSVSIRTAAGSSSKKSAKEEPLASLIRTSTAPMKPADFAMRVSWRSTCTSRTSTTVEPRLREMRLP